MNKEFEKVENREAFEILAILTGLWIFCIGGVIGFFIAFGVAK